MNKHISSLINEIDTFENIKVMYIVSRFEKKVKQCINTYIDKCGLDDYKMNEYDYIVLYVLWKAINIPNCIEEYLIIIYSYYKLEEFYFSSNEFKTKNVLHLLNNKKMTLILNILINNII
jgi:hypothetical protein